MGYFLPVPFKSSLLCNLKMLRIALVRSIDDKRSGGLSWFHSYALCYRLVIRDLVLCLVADRSQAKNQSAAPQGGGLCLCISTKLEAADTGTCMIFSSSLEISAWKIASK